MSFTSLRQVYRMIDYESLGQRIRSRRQLLGKTQKEVAVSINVAPSYYSNIERGLRIPSVETLVAIANVLHTGLDMLLVDSLANALPRRSDDEMRVIHKFLREEIEKMDYNVFDRLDEEKEAAENTQKDT
ncbi:MAG: helix-turn-helix transcriptional regulator [Clostridia bacterium]|nr:helix-turn-helix transcriptional regulator [Clostridia bacterium]